MGKTYLKIEELVGQIERGELRLPEMQRQYVWRSSQVRDLLDSLYRGYPSGAILIWETSKEAPERNFSLEQSANSFGTKKLLLDGQQRLTSLAAVLRGQPVKVRGRQRPVDILFNLDHPDEHNSGGSTDNEEYDIDEPADASPDSDQLSAKLNALTFVVATKQLASRPNWVRVSDIFASDDNRAILRSAGVHNFDDPRYNLYNNRLGRVRAIKKYQYHIDILEHQMDYEEVTKIFVRINSLGTKLRGSDLAMAQITVAWRDSLREFEVFQDQCAKSGFPLDLGVFVRNLIVYTTGQCKFHAVTRLSEQQLRDSWTACKDGLTHAMDYAQNVAGIDSPVLLSSPMLLITLGYYLHQRQFQLTPVERDRLRRWFVIANAKGRYSRGSSETILDQDVVAIRGGADAEDLLRRLEIQMGRLDITAEDLQGRNQASSLFKAMFCAFRAGGATDWGGSVPISHTHRSREHKLHFHHIFPKAVLGSQYSRTDINDICNLAFIGSNTNLRISSKPPVEYIPTLLNKIGAKPFDAQCIPIDSPELLRSESYPEFLAERRRRVADRLNYYLSTAQHGAAVGP